MGKTWWFKCLLFLGLTPISIGVLVSKHRSTEREPVRLVVSLEEEIFLAQRADAIVGEIADYLVDENVKAKVTREDGRQILISFERVDLTEAAAEKTLQQFEPTIQEVTRDGASIRVRIRHDYEQELVDRARKQMLDGIKGRIDHY